MACLLLIPVLLISIGYQPKSSFKGSLNLLVFPGSSAGKESACNAGDPSSIPGSGRSTEEIGYTRLYSWASLLVQLVKNPPAMRETWVQSLSSLQGRSSGEGNGYLLQYSGLENSMNCIRYGVAKSRTWLSDFHFTQNRVPTECYWYYNIVSIVSIVSFKIWISSH